MHPDSPVAAAKRPRRRRLACIILAFIACALLLAWKYSGTRFDSVAWRAASGNDPIRLEMIEDLMRHHQLVGMSRDEIDALLGVPPDTAYFSDFDYVYWLGPERGFISIDSEWLCLRFQDDVVADARIMRIYSAANNVWPLSCGIHTANVFLLRHTLIFSPR